MATLDWALLPCSLLVASAAGTVRLTCELGPSLGAAHEDFILTHSSETS